MSLERIRHLLARYRETLAGPLPAAPSPWDLEPGLGRELFESMLQARHLDLWAHELRARGAGHYTICSSGHEANVVLGRLTRASDPALLHYRSAAVQLERARAVPGTDAVRDIALSLVASSEEPTSGGRHKVFGSRALGIIPKTSTIGSHLPRAVGLAFGLERRPRLGLERTAPTDAIAVASFGDASLNHSTTLGALNAASWVLHQRLTLPLLLVCEDNGLGISVRTPDGWVSTRLARPAPHRLFLRPRLGPGSDLSRRPGRRRSRTPEAHGGRAPPVVCAPVGPRRQRRGRKLSPAGGDRSSGSARPGVVHCARSDRRRGTNGRTGPRAWTARSASASLSRRSAPRLAPTWKLAHRFSKPCVARSTTTRWLAPERAPPLARSAVDVGAGHQRRIVGSARALPGSPLVR